MKIHTLLIICLATVALNGNHYGQTIVELGTSRQYRLDPSGKLVYSKDGKGNRLPDFSHVGYHSGEKSIPYVPVTMTLEPRIGDDTKAIQGALDELAVLPLDKAGIRGALLLKRGVYLVNGTLAITHGGIVLRGEGDGLDGTVIIATGYDEMKYRRALISVGNTDNIELDTNSRQEIVDSYVPVGAHSFKVKSASDYKPGDHIVVHRPSTADWIHSIGCDQLKARWAGIRDVRWVKDGKAPGFHYQRLGYISQYSLIQRDGESWSDFEKRVPLSKDGTQFDFTRQWEPGEYDFYFERQITDVQGNRITFDAPIVHPMDTAYGGGAIFHYETPGRVTEVGIENLRLISEFAAPVSNHPYGHPKESTVAELHAWHGIKLNRNTENTWVRGVTGNYFGWSLVSASGKRATIQDCVNLGHASEISGGRRYPFMIDGQLNLVQRCLAYEGRHEFVTQGKTAGPNVFVDCVGFDSKSVSGPHHRYSVGTLFDNVKSEKLMESRFRGNSGTGHGWAGTQTCFYNCIAPEFDVKAPPGGVSWVIGSAPTNTDDTRVAPAGLYYQQLKDRLGSAALDRVATEELRKNLGKYHWAKERIKKERSLQ
jgi:hypothetical protein